MRLALGRRSMPTAWTVLFALVAIAGIAMRVWIYRHKIGAPTSDEAITGLMTLHLLHGHLTAFYWGSSYGGPQETYLNVPFFWIFGSGFLALRLVPIALNAVACLVLWRVGRRTIGASAAAVGAALLWIWPPFNLFQLTEQISFYGTNVLYCALVLLLALRIVERPDRLRAGIFGFVLGFAWWQTPQIVPIAIPAVVWVIWKAPSVLRHIWIAVLACIVGALPWLVWNARHDWSSLAIHTTVHLYVRSLRLFASPILPMTLGLRTPFDQKLIVPSSAVVYLVYVAIVAVFVFAATRTRHRNVSLLYLVTAMFPFVYALDRRTTFITGWPQYTVVVTPVLALLVAQVAKRYATAVALLALVCVLELVSLPRMNAYYHEAQPLPRAPRNMSPLLTTLDRLHLDRLYGDYWIAYLVDFDTKEHVIAVENQFTTVSFRHGEAVLPHDPQARYQPYERIVAATPRHGFVFFKRAVPSIGEALARHGYSRTVVGPFVVFAPPAGV